MTLLFADGFEDDLSLWNAVGGAWTVTTGRSGSGYYPPSSTGYLTAGFPSTFGPIIWGFALKTTAIVTDFTGIWAGSQNDNHVTFKRGASGEVIVTGPAVSVIHTSAIGVLPAGAWNYLEFKVYIHDTLGTVEMKVNGITVINIGPIDTRRSNSVSDSIRIGYNQGTAVPTTAAGFTVDDFYLCDANGAYNNDFLGDLTVEHLRPTGNDTSDWVGSDGNSTDNYLLVDEAGTAVTADYVQSSTVAQRDLYTIGPSARTGGAAGVLVFTNVSKTTSAPRGFKHTIKEGSAGTVRQATEMGLPTSFGELFSIFERKADGSVWLISDVNALRVGVELST